MYDVAVIGAGVVGANILRALSAYTLSLALLEKENDVGTGASRANSAIVHAGYDPKPGTKMARLNVQGSRMMEPLCRELSVPYKRNGAMVLAFDEDDARTVRALYQRGLDNGVEPLELLSPAEALALEPNLNPHITLALRAPGSAIISPWELAVACCDNAVQNGADFFPNSPVTSLEPIEGGWRIGTPSRTLTARFVVNCAGVYADRVNELAGGGGFAILPSKGEYYVFDKSQNQVVGHTIFQCPSAVGKGVLISPTVHGNLIVGPDASDVTDRDDTSTEAERLAFVRATAARSCDKVNYRESIRTFAGVRANCTEPDFIIELSRPGFVNAAGIRSPGLSASPAIALEVLSILENAGLRLEKKPDYCPTREKTFFQTLPEAEKQALIARDPHFGRVVCRCESITEGEILQALASPTCPPSLDAVKRRCNAGLGRCQGGFCGPRVCELIARTRGLDPTAVLKDLAGSYILTHKLP